MVGMRTAAISDCQKKTSPRMRSFGIPAETCPMLGRGDERERVDELFTQSENEKMTTIRMPGNEIGRMMR